MPSTITTLDQYLTEFDRLKKVRTDREPAWLRDLRARAMERFASLGFPTTRQEEWRFTNVAPIAETTFVPAGGREPAPAVIDRFRLSGVAGVEILFVDGRLAASRSRRAPLPAGVTVSSLADVLASNPAAIEPYLGRLAASAGDPFVALNTALFQDGAVVQVAPGTAVDLPLHLLFLSTTSESPAVSHPRLLVVAGKNSEVRLVESYAGASDSVYFTNAVTEMVVGENAVVDHYKVQRESKRAYHVAALHADTTRSTTFSSHSIALGGGLVRNDVVAVLDGEGGDCTLNGLYLADGHRLIDNHTTIDHAKPHCGSHEVYKGILSDQAHGVFNGKIVVRPDAQKTDAKQTNKALLLSDDALVNSKPQLEIFANDVKCTHGAAVGQLDGDAIFYLRSRGLSLAEARTVLIQAFAGDILNRIRIEPLRATLEQALVAQLPKG